MECLKVHFVFRFFYGACLLSSTCCARDHAIMFGWVNGVSLPEMRLSRVMKQSPAFWFAPCRCALSKRTQGASLSTDTLVAKLNVAALERIKDIFVLL